MSRIVVAEDDMLQREMLATMLERAGHDVIAVPGGRQCLAVLQRGRFDLLVTDVFMPDGDGMSLLVILRDQGVTIPVIGITGGADGLTHPYVAAMLSLGVDSVLAKPFAATDLRQAVARAVAPEAREAAS